MTSQFDVIATKRGEKLFVLISPQDKTIDLTKRQAMMLKIIIEKWLDE